MICHDNKCIFIHIPKTAGTSIEHSFGKVTMKGLGVKKHSTTKHHALKNANSIRKLASTGVLTWVRTVWIDGTLRTKSLNE